MLEYNLKNAVEFIEDTIFWLNWKFVGGNLTVNGSIINNRISVLEQKNTKMENKFNDYISKDNLTNIIN